MAERGAGGILTPIDPGIVTRVAQGVRYIISGVKPDTWFSPNQPLPPQAPPETKGREWDYPVGYNIQTQPRAYEALSFHELRGLAETWDILRLVIETRKDQLEALDWAIRPRNAGAGGTVGQADAAKILAVTRFFERPNKVQDWAQWLRALLEDLFVIDAPTLYRRKTRGGQLYALELMDGATIKPLIQADGRRPLPPDPAYQQVLKGVPAVDYTAEELIYAPRNLRSHKVYGFSPVEQIVMTTNIAIRRAVSQLDYYTEGTVPDAFVSVPQSWTTDQIRQFQAYFDAILSNALGERRKVRFLPGDMKYQATKEPALKDMYDEWLARIVCFAFSISPEPFIAQMNRATAEASQSRALEEGLAPLRKWVKRLIDPVIANDLGAPELEFAWFDSGTQDAGAAAQIENTYVRAGIKSINESRAGLGLAPVPGGERPMVYTGQGYVALGGTAPSKGGSGAGAAEKLTSLSFDKAYNPAQPRVPKGQSGGGQWTGDGADADVGSFEDAGDGTDAAPEIRMAADANAGIRTDAEPAIPKGFRHINPHPGGPNGPTITFQNDDPRKPSPDLPVTEATAEMVERAVLESGVRTATINSTTGGGHVEGSRHYEGKAVDIDMIDGMSVKNPRNAKKVRRLQDAFLKQENIIEDFGPAYCKRYNDGTKTFVPVNSSTLKEEHTTHIHAGGRD